MAHTPLWDGLTFVRHAVECQTNELPPAHSLGSFDNSGRGLSSAICLIFSVSEFKAHDLLLTALQRVGFQKFRREKREE